MARTFPYLLFVCFLTLGACGVKGKPLPPLEPAELGRGTPTYKRTAEQAKPAVVPSAVPPDTARDPKPSPTPDRGGQ